MKTLKTYKGLSITFKLIFKKTKKNELYFVTQEDNYYKKGTLCLGMSSNYDKANKIFKEWVNAVL